MFVKVGMNSINVSLLEAYEPSTAIFGTGFNAGRTFIGEGLEFGFGKELSSRVYVDMAYSRFKGNETVLEVDNKVDYYTMEGFQLPLVLNYLLRKPERKLRFDIGTGLHYVDISVKQLKRIGDDIRVMKELEMSKIQVVVKTGLQYRIIPNLFSSFLIKAAFSIGSYNDNPSLSLRYVFKKKP